MLEKLKEHNMTSFILTSKVNDIATDDVAVFTNRSDYLNNICYFKDSEVSDLFIPTITNILYHSAKQYLERFNIKIKQIFFEIIDNRAVERRHENSGVGGYGPHFLFNYSIIAELNDLKDIPDANNKVIFSNATLIMYGISNSSGTMVAPDFVAFLEDKIKIKLNEDMIEMFVAQPSAYQDLLIRKKDMDTKDFLNEYETFIKNILSFDLELVKKTGMDIDIEDSDSFIDYMHNTTLYSMNLFFNDDNKNKVFAEKTNFAYFENSIFNPVFKGDLTLPSIDEIKQAAEELKAKTEYEIK